MKLKIVVAILILTAVGLAQNGAPLPPMVIPAPIPLKLSVEDQRQLDIIANEHVQMKGQIEVAKKQQADAQARLNEANAFIARYDQVEAVRMAFFFRVAADVCGCKSSDLEFGADGRSVVRKAKVDKPLVIKEVGK